MIHFRSKHFPPSTNNAYFTLVIRRGNKSVPKQVLSAEGKKYKREFKTWLAKEHPGVLNFFSNKSGEFSILVVLYFKEIYNSGWPKKAKTRHKKIDATNHIKILEDALSEACGHDDSQHVTFTSVKDRIEPGASPHFELWAWNSQEEDGPIEQFLHEQRPHCSPQ